METTLYVQEASEGDYLVIKPVPGQVVAQVDPGPHMQAYARLFAGAPQLLEAVHHVLVASEDGGTMNDIDWGFLRKAFREAARVYQYESFSDAIALAESLGWVDTHGDATEGNWEGEDVDECEREAIEFIRSKGIVVLGYDGGI